MSNNFISSDMIRGHIDTIILLSLVNSDKHTNEIRDEIENKAGGQYKVKQGTFYSALQRLAKHGLVSEYRSSTADSIRRKYIHLTEKGLEYVNKNIDEWNYSKNIINNLISDDAPIEETPTIKSFPIENAETEFDFLLNNTSISSDFDLKEENTEQLDDYFKQISKSLESEIENYNKTIPILEESPIEETIEFEATNESEFVDDYSNLSVKENTETETYEQIIEKSLDQSFDDNTEEIVVEVETEEIETISDNIGEEFINDIQSTENCVDAIDEYLIRNEDEQFNLEQEILLEKSSNLEENEQIEKLETTQTVEEDKENVVDNSYVNDELLFGNDKKEIYTQLLDKLFPEREPDLKTQPEQEVKIVLKEDKSSFYDQMNEFEELVSNDDNFSENLPKDNSFEEPKVALENVYDEKPAFNFAIKKQTYNNTVKFDYSDIIEYAKKEGFTVKTSYSTNKSEIGKVLINKLKFHTSWLFFFSLLIELLLVCFVFKTNSGLNTSFYVISGLIFLILPIIYTVNYFTDKKKAIQNISSFRNTLEIVFIICLNLILLVSAFAIISDINFSSIVDLLRYIIIPILLIVNIPLYYIYKYLLLQKNIYYTK